MDRLHLVAEDAQQLCVLQRGQVRQEDLRKLLIVDRLVQCEFDANAAERWERRGLARQVRGEGVEVPCLEVARIPVPRLVLRELDGQCL